LLEQEIGDPSKCTLEGPDIALDPNCAFALSLLFHELATNAARHGSLSTPEGHVEISWHLEEGDLVLTWMESGGPPPCRPSSPGFGSLLVTSAAVKLKGSANLLYLQSGPRCDLRVSLLACWPRRRGALLLGSREERTVPARAM
jgi:two-component sensor histidine kinase